MVHCVTLYEPADRAVSFSSHWHCKGENQCFLRIFKLVLRLRFKYRSFSGYFLPMELVPIVPPRASDSTPFFHPVCHMPHLPTNGETILVLPVRPDPMPHEPCEALGGAPGPPPLPATPHNQPPHSSRLRLPCTGDGPRADSCRPRSRGVAE